ncbi:MAG: HlyD family efflux transporter periplasmic adaptor subunit [Eubacteriales bacterium]
MKEKFVAIKEKCGSLFKRGNKEGATEVGKSAIKEGAKFTKKKIIIASVCSVVVVSVGIGAYAAVNYTQNNKATQSAMANSSLYMEEEVTYGDIIVGLTEMGTAGLYATSVTYEFETTLEEVYVKAGQYVEEDEVLAKIDIELLEDAYETLELELASAQITLDNAILNAATTELSASSALNSTEFDGTNAERLYTLTIAELDIEYTAILNDIADLEEDIEELEDNYSNYYGDEFNIDTLSSSYYSKNDEIIAKENEIEVKEAELYALEVANGEAIANCYNTANSTMGLTNSTISTGSCDCCKELQTDGVAQVSTDADETTTTATYNYPSYADHQAYYSTSEDALESAISSLESQLTTLQSSLSSLATQVSSAESSYESDREDLPDQIADAYEEMSNLKLQRDNYEIAMASATLSADSDYNSTMQEYNAKDAEYSNTIASANLSVTTAQLNVDDIQEQIDELDEISASGYVVAPCAGYVMSISDEDTTVYADYAIATIADNTMVELYVSIEQTDISAISIGMETYVVFDAYEDLSMPAEVESISITSSGGMSSSVYYSVTLTCDISSYEDIVVYEGMSADITFIQEQESNVLVVSSRCITNEDGKQYVKMIGDTGEVIMKEVETGFSDGFDVEIISGLEEGDIVIIESAVTNSAS